MNHDENPTPGPSNSVKITAIVGATVVLVVALLLLAYKPESSQFIYPGLILVAIGILSVAPNRWFGHRKAVDTTSSEDDRQITKNLRP